MMIHARATVTKPSRAPSGRSLLFIRPQGTPTASTAAIAAAKPRSADASPSASASSSGGSMNAASMHNMTPIVFLIVPIFITQICR